MLFASQWRAIHLIFISNQYLSCHAHNLDNGRFCKENGFSCIFGCVRVCIGEIDVFLSVLLCVVGHMETIL